MAYDGTIKFDTSLNADGVKSGISTMDKIVSGGAKAVVAGIAGITTAFAGVTVASLKMGGDLEQSLGGIETMFKNSSGKVVDNAKNAFMTAGLSANDYMEQVTSFSASLLQGLGGDTEKAANIAHMAMVDMSDNANKFGTDIGMIQSAYQGFAKQNYTMLDNLKLGYGGTASEMARLVNESGVLNGEFVATANNVKDIPFDTLIQAIHNVQDEMGVTGTTSKEAMETLNGSITATKAAWENFLTGVGSSTQLADTVANTADLIMDRLGEIVPRLAETLPAVLDRLRAKAGEMFPALKPGIDGFSKLIAAGTELAKAVLPPLISVIGGLLSVVGSLSPAILALVAAFLAYKAATAAATLAAKAAGVAIDGNITKANLSAIATGLMTKAKTALTVATGNATAALALMTAGEATAAQVSTLLTVKEAALAAIKGVLTGQIGLATAAQLIWNAAMAANPIGLIIAGVALLVTGIVALIAVLSRGSEEYRKQKQEVEALSEAQETLAASTEESADAYKSSSAEIAANAKVSKDLVSQLKQVQSSSDSAEDKHRKMADTVAQLNASVEGLNIAYDEETGAIRNINTGQEISLNQLEQLVDAKAELAQANAWTQRYNELISEQTRIQEELAVIEAKKQEIMDNAILSTKEQNKLIAELDEAAEGHAATMADVEMRLDVVNENLASSNTSMAESVVSDYERMEQAVTESGESIEEVAAQWGVSVDEILAAMERENISLDDWVTKQQDAWEDYENAVKERTEGVINSFKEIPGEFEMSATEMLEILQTNKERYAEWETTMEEITRQLGPTAAEEFAKLGPEATSAMQEILDSADLLDQYRETFGVKLDEVTGLAVEDWNDPSFIGAPSGAIDSSAQMVSGNTALDTAMTGTMQSAVTAAEAVDFTGVGQGIATDIASSITGQTGAVTSAVQGMSTSVQGVFNTMSQQTASTASQMMNSVASAVQSGGTRVTSSATSMSTSVQSVFKTMSTQSQSTATQMMTQINSTVVSRTATIKSSITSMGNSITTALNTAKTQAVNIVTQMMTGINSAIVTRSSTVKASMVSCANGVVTAVTDMKTKGISQAEQMMTGINSAIVSGASAVKASSKAVADGVVENLQGMVSGGKKAAEDMMDGMLKAMNNKASDLYAKAREIANKIADTLADAWDERSPSRVSYKIMEFFMLGMYNAMDGMAGLLFREADGIADGLTERLTLSPDTLTNWVDQLRTITEINPLGGTALVPLAAGAGGSGGVRYSTSLTQNITTPKPLSASEMTREGQDLLRRSKWQLP